MSGSPIILQAWLTLPSRGSRSRRSFASPSSEPDWNKLKGEQGLALEHASYQDKTQHPDRMVSRWHRKLPPRHL
jgi:hypothetical protein